MGASSSINGISNGIYISYDASQTDNRFISTLCDELKEKKYNIIYSQLISKHLDHLSSYDISSSIENIMSRTSYVVLCISEETIRSFNQAIEIDNALNTNKQILYLMIDKYYTPFTNNIVKGMVGANKWLNFYDKTTVNKAINYLIDLDL